jgi:uncharacterized membrane protein
VENAVRLILPCTLMLLAAGCLPAVPKVGPELTASAARAYPDVAAEEFESDREAFLEHCSGCHLLRPPHRIERAELPELMEEMQEEVGFDDEAKRRIHRYIVAAQLWRVDEIARREAEKEAKRAARSARGS